MAKLTPDYPIFNNAHAFMHCGGIGSNQTDPGVDLTLMTSSGNQCVHAKNGNKTEYVTNEWSEESGFGLKDGKGIARKILARRGDIHITADDGDIYLKATNIYIETKGVKSEGKSNGSILIKSNGQINISGEDEVKVSSGTNLALIAKSKLGLSSFQTISIGKFLDTGPDATSDFISNFMANGWTAFLDAAKQALSK